MSDGTTGGRANRRPLEVGEQAPWFSAPALQGNPNYNFGSVAGRVVLLMLGGSIGDPASAAALAAVLRFRSLFDDLRACFFGVSTDPADAGEGRIGQSLPGIRWFLDHDRAITQRYGAALDDGQGGWSFRPHFLLLDHRLRVAARFPLDQAEAATLAAAGLVSRGCEATTAPVLVVPRVFEPELCRHLIDRYEADGGNESGYMKEIGGRTVGVVDHSFKRRRDYTIEDIELQRAIKHRLERRLLPEIKRAFSFEVTRIERWLVACYDNAEGGGFFSAHRDDTTKGTAHRRFACTINLNAEAFEGGNLRFPEFGQASYRAPTGGAVIFSCSLLHEATPVTSGRRYAFLPFFYDEAAQQIRERNLQYLGATPAAVEPRAA